MRLELGARPSRSLWLASRQPVAPFEKASLFGGFFGRRGCFRPLAENIPAFRRTHRIRRLSRTGPLAGGTPAKATGTVALLIPTASFRLKACFENGLDAAELSGFRI